ncbi:uncharacterized protein Bfra_002220 [Botrytis fragariae]|uniref:Uncharacterized protein n=1 Tax=Botrytis fragariae TaxID=1964551 RepID=A0A8H6AYF7_9HELO|nr:uncharacterized protein Bfra_002220 [Botrytis fragariae]KAF5875824.1 hypothetical protein Bfra_002220 [Botrytis fragariae]
MASKNQTLDADSTSKASRADAMMVETSIKSPKPNVCALLDEIPRGTNKKSEIRDEIWRLIFVKPVAIVLRVRKREYLFATGCEAEGHKHCRLQRKYSYSWAQAPVPETYFGGNTISREITWTTNPTREQLELIQSGVKEFTIDDSPEPGQQIKCAVHNRDGFGPQIINKTEFQIHPFGRSVSIIRVCKQMEQECTAILYGENKYEFDLSYCHKKHLLKTPWDIPGFPLFEELPSKATINIAVERLFDLECYHPAFIAKDPFVRFIAYIERKNVSLLRDIKFDGEFTPTLRTRREKNTALGLGAILPMYTLIIAEVCPRIRKLTLHQRPLAFDYYNRTGEKEKEMGYDYGKMYSIVGKVVFGLPNLQQLQLGAYSQPPIACYPSGRFADHRCEWGKSIEWMKFVDERSVNQLFTPFTTPNSLLNNGVGQAHVPIRSGIYSRYKDLREHERPGSYGTSFCTWTVTLCPSQTNPGSTGKLPRDSDHRKDGYGSLPEMSDDEWKCSDAHGGIRRDHGRILNISTKVDGVGAPRTWIPGQRVKKWWH